MQLLGLYVVDLASVRAPDCCPLEIRAQMLYVLLVDPASVRATGCSLCGKAYISNQVGIGLVVVDVLKYLKNGLYQKKKKNRLSHLVGTSSSSRLESSASSSFSLIDAMALQPCQSTTIHHTNKKNKNKKTAITHHHTVKVRQYESGRSTYSSVCCCQKFSPITVYILTTVVAR